MHVPESKVKYDRGVLRLVRLFVGVLFFSELLIIFLTVTTLGVFLGLVILTEVKNYSYFLFFVIIFLATTPCGFGT